MARVAYETDLLKQAPLRWSMKKADCMVSNSVPSSNSTATL
ncbi:hypothetical protein ACVIW3_003457 [Bradyrhizobium diazoefficiens]